MSVRALRALISAGIWRSLKFLRGSQFLHFFVFFAAMQGAMSIAASFFTVYMLRDLHNNYLQFITSRAVMVVMQILTLNAFGRISNALGNWLMLVAIGWMIPIMLAL